MHNEIDIYKNCKDLQNLLNITLVDVIKPLRAALVSNRTSKIIELEIDDAENKAFEYIAAQITTIGNGSESESSKCLLEFPKSDVCYRCVGLDEDTIEGLIKIRNLSFLDFLELEEMNLKTILFKYMNENSYLSIKKARNIIKRNIDLIYSNKDLNDNTRNLIKLVTRLVDNKCTIDDINVIGIPDWENETIYDNKISLNLPNRHIPSDSNSQSSQYASFNSDHSKSISDYHHPSSFISTTKPINKDALLKAFYNSNIVIDDKNFLNTDNSTLHINSLSVPNTPNVQKSRSVGGSEEILTDIIDKPSEKHPELHHNNNNNNNASPLFFRKKYNKNKPHLKSCNQLQRSLSHEFECNNNLMDNKPVVPHMVKNNSSVFQFTTEKQNFLDKERRSSYEEKTSYNNTNCNSVAHHDLDNAVVHFPPNSTKYHESISKLGGDHKFESENKFGIQNIVKPQICAVCKVKKIFPKLLTCEICRIKIHKSCLPLAQDIQCLASPNFERKDSHNSIANIAINHQGSDSNSASSCNSSPASPFMESGYNSAATNHISPRHPAKLLTAQRFEFSVIDETDSVKTNSNDFNSINNDPDSSKSHLQNRLYQVGRLESTESQDEYSRLSRTNSISVALKEWEIPLESLEIREQLGRGSFSTVYKGKWHGEVAVKIMNIDSQDESDSCMSAFKSEVGALHKTRHENLVLFMGACMKPPKLAIVTQLSPGEPLFHQLHSKHVTFPVIRAINIASQVAKGMGYLHAKNILHKDLKSRNIFIENNCKAVISDFGLFDFVRMCKQARSGNYLKIPHGWLCYLSPELIRNLNLMSIFSNNVTEDLPFSKASDIYAFGTIWYEILNNKWPYEGLPYEAIIYKVGKGIKESLKISQAKEFKDLLLLCWSTNSDLRPQFTNIVQLLEKLPKLQRSPSYPVKSVTMGRSHDNLMT